MVTENSAEVLGHVGRVRENLLNYIIPRVPDVDREKIGKAVEFSILAHQNQFRVSGMPYFEHPFEVAKLLADFNMDTTTIAAGLLHDVLEDTEATRADIEKEFGEEVAFLVEAVTKISAIQARSRLERQAEFFRKMLLSMAKDFRVIMIKFADRLHNMRTLGYMKEEKKRAIASETLEVYAPLAHRLGLARIRWELEDISFKYVNPEAYKLIVGKVVEKREQREEFIRKMILPMKEALNKGGVNAEVYGRPKHLFSIFKKMESRKCSFEDLYDLLAVRILVPDIPSCYSALGMLHGLWIPLQTRFKDFIASPKSNMYQSLHTTVIGIEGRPVECQIRTRDMDMTAEYGIAAHWAYKEGKATRKVEQESKWLTQFVEWQKDYQDSAEFMEFFKVDLKTEEIFVFSPKGDLIQLPKGSTTLDFAFAVHSEVGLHCIGAKVDGKVVPLDKVLQTGNTVEILKSVSQRPSHNWLRIVVTVKAKNRIRRWLRTELQEKSVSLGKELLANEFQRLRIPEQKQTVQLFQDKFGVETLDQMYLKIGSGEITVGAVSPHLEKLFPKKSAGMLQRVNFMRPKEKKVAVKVSGMDNFLIRFAGCCSPVPGDPIIGYITRGQGVSIHRAKCSEGLRLTKEKERLVPVEWENQESKIYEVFLEINAKDRIGLLQEISKAFSRFRINILRASIVSLSGQTRNRFKIQVTSLEHLEKAIQHLRVLKSVDSVLRKSVNLED